METISQQFGDALLTFSPVPWDCAAFSRNCYELQLTPGQAWPDPLAVRRFMRDKAMDAVTYRSAPGCWDVARFLQAAGFFHAELQLDFIEALSDRQAPTEGPGIFRPAVAADDDAILDIAETSYPGGRYLWFHWATLELVGKRYRNWTARLLREFRELAVVIEVDGQIAGYAVGEPTTDPHRVRFTLAAVRKVGPPSRLVGHKLFASTLAYFAGRGFRLASSSLAAENMPSLNLHASLGAVFTRAVEVFQCDVRQEWF